MALLSKIFGGFGLFPSASTETSGTSSPEQWLTDLLGGMVTATGIRVSPQLAMTVPGVAACVSIISEDLAKVPLRVMRKKRGGGKELATEHPLYNLLHSSPVPWMTSFAWRRAMIASAMTRGNSFARVFRLGDGEVYRLGLIKPGQGSIRWTTDGEPFFDVLTDGVKTTLGYQDVIHLPYKADAEVGIYGGIAGVSPIARHPECIALAVATERFAATFFRNGARPSVAIKMPGKFPSDKVAARVRASLERAYSGLDNAFKIAVLELGMELQQFSFSNSDSQLIEVRKEQANEVCRIFNVPPHKIGILDRATFSNIEHQAIEYVTGPVSTMAQAFESSIWIACLTDAEKEDYTIEFDLNGLLRGDIQSRYRAYAVGRQWGWLNADEIREWENMDPLPEEQGKTYLAPTNMVPADKLGEEPANDPDPKPEPKPAPRASVILGPDGRKLVIGG